MRLDGNGMANKNWKPLTPKQEYEKAMRDTDAWVKKEMIKHADEIELMLQAMEAERDK